MGLAKFIGRFLLIAGMIAFLHFIGNTYQDGDFITGDDYIGRIALVSGVLSFISSWIIYGIGQMVDDVNTLRYLAEKQDTPKG